MPKFSDYEKFTLPLTVTLIDNTILTLHYCPAAYNWKFRRKLQALAQQTVQATLNTASEETEEKAAEEKKPDKPVISDIEFICHMLAAWDWTDDNDKMMPITPEFIEEKVNTKDQDRMAQAIWDDLFPNAEKATEDNSPSP